MSHTEPGSASPDVAHALSELQQSFPLPDGASAVELFTERVELAGLPIELVGLSAELGGALYTGSAADVSFVPLQRAYFELLERLSIGRALGSSGSFRLQSPQGELLGLLEHDTVFPPSPEGGSFRHAKSNGVAIAPTWAEACARAADEAVERDCLLRSWFGQLELGAAPLLSGIERAHWAALGEFYELQLRATRWCSRWVVLALGFPKSDAFPTLLSAAARSELEPAIKAARIEFIQRLGFLYGEEQPSEHPPVTPDAHYHQELYLWRGSRPRLRAWLDGGLPRSSAPAPLPPEFGAEAPGPVAFAELTPAEFGPRVSVARAWWPSSMPLVFGEGYPGYPAGHTHPIA